MAEPNDPQPSAQPDGQVAEPAVWPAPVPSGTDPPARGPLTSTLILAAVLAGSAVLGLAAGFVWAAVAPRPLLVIVSHGSADVVNVETSAFIAGTGWFVLITVIGGIISGLLGYLGAVRRHGAAAMAAVLVGALAAALLARWIGQRSGAATFYHQLATAHPGLELRAPLHLGGIGALAFWPLAAGLAAGGLEARRYFSERRANLSKSRKALARSGETSQGLGASWTPPLGSSDPRD